ncbi:hypothetical protein GE061_009059 [Apolygus lucorum]|uniref:Reverse transcriptase domain-containing protein n=1 Tax=Apolygus lucorum TaxID=248454 RepID=A0A8S9Y0K6_APOLU|nr:hypothetical protein GE061_009059 [Apolygus lucorum]
MLDRYQSVKLLIIVEHHLLPEEIEAYSVLKPDFKLISATSRPQGWGGSCIYAAESIKCKSIDSLCNKSVIGHLEISAIQVSVLKCVIIAVYRPPGGSMDIFYEVMMDVLESRLLSGGMIALAGDFNVHLDKVESDQSVRDFVDFFKSYGLEVNNFEVTRPESHHCLDTVITNIPGTSTTVMSHLFADHYTLHSIFPLAHRQETQIQKMPHRRITEDGILEFCSALPLVVSSSLCAPSGDIIVALVHRIFQEHFPMSFSRRWSRNKDVWFTEDLRTMRDRLLELSDLSRNGLVPRSKVNEYRRQYRLQLHTAQVNYNSTKLKNSTNFARTAWSIINCNKHAHGNLPDNLTASEFADFFQTSVLDCVGSVPRTEVDPMNLLKSVTSRTLGSIFLSPVSELEVLRIIDRMKNSASQDIYGLSAVFLKKAKSSVAPVICKLVNTVFSTGEFPLELKLSKVIPVPKKSKSSSVDEFRPIAQVPLLGKIIEGAICERLREFFESNELLCGEQHGFRRGRSTISSAYKLLAYNRPRMNLLFTKKELREIFKPRTTTPSAHALTPPAPHLRPSQPKGHNTKKGKPPASSKAALRPTQRSPSKPPQPATSKPLYTIPARKRTLTTFTSAAHEAIMHGEPPRSRWNIRPIDIPKTTKRAKVVIDYYQAKNARRFEEYIPNFVHPNNFQIADEIGEVEEFEQLIHRTITSLISPRPIPLQVSPSPGPKRRRRRGRKARALLSKLRSGQLLIITTALSKKRRRVSEDYVPV